VVIDAKEKGLANAFRQPGDLLNGHSGSPTKNSKLTLYPGDVKDKRLLKMMMVR
jgi:hypothetical protein